MCLKTNRLSTNSNFPVACQQTLTQINKHANQITRSPTEPSVYVCKRVLSTNVSLINKLGKKYDCHEKEIRLSQSSCLPYQQTRKEIRLSRYVLQSITRSAPSYTANVLDKPMACQTPFVKRGSEAQAATKPRGGSGDELCRDGSSPPCSHRRSAMTKRNVARGKSNAKFD